MNKGLSRRAGQVDWTCSKREAWSFTTSTPKSCHTFVKAGPPTPNLPHKQGGLCSRAGRQWVPTQNVLPQGLASARASPVLRTRQRTNISQSFSQTLLEWSTFRPDLNCGAHCVATTKLNRTTPSAPPVVLSACDLLGTCSMRSPSQSGARSC